MFHPNSINAQLLKEEFLALEMEAYLLAHVPVTLD